MKPGRQTALAVRRAFASIILVIAAAGNSALAEDESVVQEVVVTGTRIASPGVTANSPVATISAQEIQFQQPAAVEELIKSLPAAGVGVDANVNNGTTGGATIDLRALGPNRSLVLVNGRRIVPFDLVGAVDTNSIPLALIDRFDLVTGGASAVYGADAVAGVVNFILKRNFEGLDLSASTGMSGQHDARRYRADATLGTNFADSRGNIVLSLGYTEMDPLLQGARDFGKQALSSTTGVPQGSGTAVPLIITSPNLKFPGGQAQIDPTTGAFVPVYQTYNFNPTNFFVNPLRRTQATALGRYDINDHAEAYAELFYTRSDVISQLASSGSFLNVYSVPIGNPFIPDPARQQLCAAKGIPAASCVAGNPTEILMALGRRITELGPRENDFENQMFQYNIGVRGDIVASWKYDVYWSRGESDQIQTRGNWGSNAKLQQSLRSLNGTSCEDPSNGCVPINLFGPEGSITPAMTKFIDEDALLRQIVQQDVASGSITGDLGDTFKSPWALHPIGVAFGGEYRAADGRNKSDAASQIQGEVLGTGAPRPDRSGKLRLREVYTEALVPILSDKPFAHAVTAELGYRHTDFTAQNSEQYGTYKYGGEWAPLQELRFRGMKERATRAPNVNELFEPQSSALSNLAVDPCQGNRISAAQANTAGTLSNLCRLTGVPLASIGSLPAPSSGQINNRVGGNPGLKAERADTTTIGFVWQPDYLEGLVASIDYYRIKVNQAITTPSVTDVLNQCYNPAFNPTYTFNSACAQVLRGPVTGTFNGADAPGVVTNRSNAGTLETYGYDLSLKYSVKLPGPGWGRLSFAFDGNDTQSWKFQANATSINRECAGFYSIACGSAPPDSRADVRPKYKWTQRTIWSVSEFDFTYEWRHLSAVRAQDTSFLPLFSRIPNYEYFDFATAWHAMKNVRLNFTITNLMDKKPPIVGSTIGTTAYNSGNTFPAFYDPVGRYFTLAATVQL
jgi:outer membrane receptor protein involved in Fe transport